MRLIDVFLSKIAPHNCLVCGADNTLLCLACVDKLPVTAEQCYRCQRLSPAGLTCARCLTASPLYGVKVATRYAGAAKTLIWRLKLSGARSAAVVMADCLASSIEPSPGITIVPVPTATGRARQRGYDQAKVLARELARRTGLPCRDYLARHGQTGQHGLSRSERLGQLTSAFRVKRPRAVSGARILLVDDVITTGATLEAAARALRQAGAQKITAAVFARPDHKVQI